VNSQRWSSDLGFLLSAVGAAVGMGSIWRFPYLAAAAADSHLSRYSSSLVWRSVPRSSSLRQ